MRAVVVIVALTGCFVKPGAPGATDDAAIDGPGDGSAGDGPPMIDATTTTLCAISEDFNSVGPPCGTWGAVDGQSVSRNGIQLIASPLASAGSATCRTHPLEPNGIVTVLLDSVANTQSGHYAKFTLTASGGGASVAVYREVGTDRLDLYCNGPLTGPTYDPAVHRYLRFVLVQQSSDLQVTLQSSGQANIDTFTNVLGSCMIVGAALAPMTVSFGSGLDGTVVGSPSSQWDDFVYDCQQD